MLKYLIDTNLNKQRNKSTTKYYKRLNLQYLVSIVITICTLINQ